MMIRPQSLASLIWRIVPLLVLVSSTAVAVSHWQASVAISKSVNRPIDTLTPSGRLLARFESLLRARFGIHRVCMVTSSQDRLTWTFRTGTCRGSIAERRYDYVFARAQGPPLYSMFGVVGIRVPTSLRAIVVKGGYVQCGQDGSRQLFADSHYFPLKLVCVR